MRHKKIFRRRFLTPHKRWKIKQAFKRHKWAQVLIAIIILLIIGMAINEYLDTDKEVTKEVVKQEVITKEVVKKQQVPQPKEEDTYKITARDGYILGRYGNVLDIEGNYAKRVDNSVAIVSIKPEDEFGNIEVVLPDASLNTEDKAKLEGEVKIVMSRFKAYEKWQDKAIVLDEEFFGDTKKGFDSLPKTRALLAAFGEADILLDDQEVYGNLKAMVMYTEGIRDEGQAITKDGEAYAAKFVDKDFADKKDRELHIFVHSEHEDKKNFPPQHVWVNVFFEDPRVLSVPNGVKK